MSDTEDQSLAKKVLEFKLCGLPAGKTLSSLGQLVASVLVIIALYNGGNDAQYIEKASNALFYGFNLSAARNIAFLGSLLSLVLTLLSFAPMCFGGKGIVGEVAKNAMEQFNDGVLYTTISMTVAALWFIYVELPEDSESEIDKQNEGFLLLVPAIIFMFSKYVLDVLHSTQINAAELAARPKDSQELSEGFYMSARGPAVTASTALLIYTVSVSGWDTSSAWEDIGSESFLVLILAIYTGAAILEKMADDLKPDGAFRKVAEYIKGVFGLNLTQICMYFLLISGAFFVGAQRSQESVFILIGILYLDAMQTGSLQRGEITKITANAFYGTLYRLLQLAVGLVSFIIIRQDGSEVSDVLGLKIDDLKNATKLEEEAVLTTVKGFSDVVFGIGLAAAFVKILTVLYVTKDLIYPSAEQTFRRFSTTGLLFASSYLWLGGSDLLDEASELDFTDVTFVFVSVIIIRVLDSYLNFWFEEKESWNGDTSKWTKFKAWAVWWDTSDSDTDRPFDKKGIHRPGADNVRTWLTFGSLVASLAFISRYGVESQPLRGKIVKADASASTEQGYWSAAMALIVVHVVVVLSAIVSDLFDPSGILGKISNGLSLSRSALVRLVVSTIVICSLIILAKNTVLVDDSGTITMPDGPGNNLLGAIVTYLFADAMGAELL